MRACLAVLCIIASFSVKAALVIRQMSKEMAEIITIEIVFDMLSERERKRVLLYNFMKMKEKKQRLEFLLSLPKNVNIEEVRGHFIELVYVACEVGNAFMMEYLWKTFKLMFMVDIQRSFFIICKTQKDPELLDTLLKMCSKFYRSAMCFSEGMNGLVYALSRGKFDVAVRLTKAPFNLNIEDVVIPSYINIRKLAHSDYERRTIYSNYREVGRVCNPKVLDVIMEHKMFRNRMAAIKGLFDCAVYAGNKKFFLKLVEVFNVTDGEVKSCDSSAVHLCENKELKKLIYASIGRADAESLPWIS